jgi:hypothetical protein
MTMNEAYWSRLRKIGDVVTQELSRGCCERDIKRLHKEIIDLPCVTVSKRKYLPESWVIYFVLDELDSVLYVGIRFVRKLTHTIIMVGNL